MAQQLPPDFAAALDRSGPAKAAFSRLPAEQQHRWVTWATRPRRRAARAARIDEAVRRLGARPQGVTEETAVREPVPPPPTREWWPWLLALLILVLGGILAWYLLSHHHHKKSGTQVPAVVGLQEAQAVAELRGARLLSVSHPIPSQKPHGTVLGQNPQPGKVVSPGSTVVLEVSGAAAKNSVPDVVGLSVAQAVAKLAAAHLNSSRQSVYAARPVGTVATETPGAGSQVAQGSTVVLGISRGAGRAAVPAVVGMKEAAGVSALQAKGLVPNPFQVSSAQPAGTIIAQNPQAGTTVAKGSKVRINVSTGGSATTTTTTTTTTATTTTTPATPATRSSVVPSVVGLAQAPAEGQINAAGFRLVVTFVNSTQPLGRVTAESPAGGSTAPRGTRVGISISNGPNPQPPASVPDVTGQSQQSATTTLQQAGFGVVVLKQKTTNVSQQNVVIYETPAAGASIPTGSRVTIVIGVA